MSPSENGTTGSLLSTETKVTIPFVILAVGLWDASTAVTDDQTVRFAILLGVGIVLPTMINELR